MPYRQRVQPEVDDVPASLPSLPQRWWANLPPTANSSIRVAVEEVTVALVLLAIVVGLAQGWRGVASAVIALFVVIGIVTMVVGTVAWCVRSLRHLARSRAALADAVTLLEHPAASASDERTGARWRLPTAQDQQGS